MKHSLDEVRAEYNRLDRLLGIDTGAVELCVSRHSVQRLGSFRSPARPGAAPLRISLSPLVLEEDELFLDTIRHEYAHAAAYIMYPGKKHGHDALWKSICRVVGCSDKSQSRSEAAARLRQERAKYTVRCRGCGLETSYVRRGKTVELLMKGRGRRLRCSRCGGSDFELNIVGADAHNGPDKGKSSP